MASPVATFSLVKKSSAISAILAIGLFLLIDWLIGGGAGPGSRCFKAITTFTVAVALIDFVRRIGVVFLQERFAPLIGLRAVTSAATLLALVFAIWHAPDLYYRNGSYLYPGTWLDLSCITQDDTYLVVMVLISPAFAITSFACDLWLMRSLVAGREDAS